MPAAVFQKAHARKFKSRIAVDALYLFESGGACQVRVIETHTLQETPDDFQYRTTTDDRTFAILKEAIASPKKDDRMIVDEEVLRVVRAVDYNGMEWRVTTRPYNNA